MEVDNVAGQSKGVNEDDEKTTDDLDEDGIKIEAPNDKEDGEVLQASNDKVALVEGSRLLVITLIWILLARWVPVEQLIVLAVTVRSTVSRELQVVRRQWATKYLA